MLWKYSKRKTKLGKYFVFWEISLTHSPAHLITFIKQYYAYLSTSTNIHNFLIAFLFIYVACMLWHACGNQDNCGSCSLFPP